jgi:hypothetical protein
MLNQEALSKERELTKLANLPLKVALHPINLFAEFSSNT